jgi:hypothetical protein
MLLSETFFINLIDVKLQERINDCQFYSINVIKVSMLQKY